MPWPSAFVIAAVAVGQVGHAMRNVDHEAKQQALRSSLTCDVRSGDVAKVKQELQDDPFCVHRVTSDGISALGTAIYENYLEIVKLLLKHGAQVNDEDGGGSPLIEAAGNGNVKIIRELVRYGAKVDPPGKSGAPLFSAVKNNNFWTVKALIEYKANVNAVDDMQETPLHKACVKSGDYEIVKLLVDAKANVNAKNSKGWTPLSVAMLVGRDYIYMPRVGYYIDKRKITPLLDAGAEVNAVNNHQQTALHLAVWDPDALQLLLQHKADVNAADENGTTPLMAALEEDEPEPLAVKYLLDAKADVNVKLNLSTPLHLAVKKNLTEETELLLAAKADVNAKDAEGKTPFDYAEGEVKELLKKYGGAGGESWRVWGAELQAKLKKKLKKVGFKWPTPPAQQ